ncbi:putative hydro-lyase [Corynebacterium sp. 3HC-13]|uniref:putative hydro-lyase n=1 Tax=Corynebacterium poyangense TaxID=2684405 RepID=UPI001CCFE1C6|nr:putative hydro-lyase [Corynebacterium poyangense]MBZ8176943.1 putative hydro-lyase [Corynebacterium poyangense]
MENSDMTPAQVRERARTENMVTTAGYARGYMQANLLAVPQRYAFDFLVFAQRNPKPCPVVGVLEAGQLNSELFPAGDIRTDIPAYRIYRDGVCTEEKTNVLEEWSEDMVAFLIGCSFSFETALYDNGIPLAHIEQGRNVPMFNSCLPCAPAGIFSGNMVVSMRPIPQDRIVDAVRITSRYPEVHGTPVHIGDPTSIGIDDLAQPDYGDAVDIPDGTVPVFWACGVTPQAIVMNSRPDFAITHAPGKMLVTDIRDMNYQIP